MPDFNLQDAAGLVTPQPLSGPDLSDPSSLAQFLGYNSAPPTPGIDAPVTSPDQLPAVSTAPTSPQTSLHLGQSAAAGSKVGVSGYNPAAMTAIQRGPQTALDKKMAADRAEVQQQFAPIQTEEKAAVDAGIAAKLAEGQLESQKAHIAAEAKLKIAAANQDFLTKEKAAMDNSAAEAQANFANYKASLMDYAASGVNPSQLWDNAGTTGQFGIVATAFMHDFLAAKGIQTSGMESINSAIKNNINAQLDNMRRKLDVAQGFKQLWEMQRSQSATDAEARARMNGFYLSALSNQVEGQLGQYDSQLALVKAQAAKAAIQQEQVKNDLLVQKHIDDAANQRATNRVHMYASELSASSAKYTADAHVKAAEIAAGKNQVSPLANVIVDTSASGGNVIKRRLLPGIEDKEGKTRTEAANVFTTVGNIEKLIQLQDQIAHVPPDIGIEALKRMQSEERRVAELVRNSVKMSIIYDNSGKQINEQEVKLYDELVSKKDWFLNGDNIRTLGTLKDMMIDKENNKLSAISTEILPGDPMYGASTGGHNMAVSEKALSEIQSAPGAGRHVNTETEEAIKQVTAPKAGEDAYSGPGLLGKAKQQFGLEPAYNKETGSGMNNQEWADRQAYKQFLEQSGIGGEVKQGAPDPSKSFVGVTKLGELAKQGDTRAVEALHEFAAKPPEDDPLVGYYAQWELAQIGQK
jgi:hypothetical protein